MLIFFHWHLLSTILRDSQAHIWVDGSFDVERAVWNAREDRAVREYGTRYDTDESGSKATDEAEIRV